MSRSQRVWAATAIAAVCVVIVVVVTTYAASSQLAMDSKRWQDNTWLGYSLKLTADKRSNTLSFTFPGLQSPKDGIDFLDTIHSFTPALANASSLTVTYTMQTTHRTRVQIRRTCDFGSPIMVGGLMMPICNINGGGLTQHHLN